MKRFLLSLMAIATLSMPSMAQNIVKNLYTTSSRLDCKQIQSTQTVQLNRYLFAGYNTLCLPMSVSNEQLQQALPGIRLERMVAVQQEGKTLNLCFIDCTNEGIQAGVPYLIYSPKTQNLRLKNTEAMNLSDNLTTVRLSDNQGNTVSFSSSWQSISEDGLYGIPAKQDAQILESILIRTDADKIILPTRCSFNWENQSSSATDIVIRHIQSLDEVTGINELASDKSSGNKAMYDLNGRKISTAKKGVVIQNGKKVIK